MRIVAESNEPGSMIRAVAARHEVCMPHGVDLEIVGDAAVHAIHLPAR